MSQLVFNKKMLRQGQQLLGLLDKTSDVLCPRDAELGDTPLSLSRNAVVIGLWGMFILFFIFGIWAAIAPISTAAVAQGQVTLDSNKKTIQHLEGGIVKELRAKEGGVVNAGDVLIRLDETSTKARLDMLRSQSMAYRASAARLVAERDSAPTITFPDDLLKAKKEDVAVAANLDAQQRLFDSRRKNIEGQVNILNQQIAQKRNEIVGLRSQVSAANRQLSLLNEEINVVKKLLQSGNAMKPRLLALQRQSAELGGAHGDHVAMISRAEQAIGEAELNMINLRNKFLNDVVTELRDAQVQITDLEEKIRAAADMMNRIDIIAPITGTVTGLKVHTIGGVITPGEQLMDIVPRDDLLIVEAKVSPQDIDSVRAGLTARVVLTVYKSRKVPPIEGVVRTVSADRITNDRANESYYLARIGIPKSELKKMPMKVELYPGMPVDVLIVTGERTMLSYLVSPISDYMNHSFREK